MHVRPVEGGISFGVHGFSAPYLCTGVFRSVITFIAITKKASAIIHIISGIVLFLIATFVLPVSLTSTFLFWLAVGCFMSGIAVVIANKMYKLP